MRKSKQLASLTLAVMTLAGTSAFAESRHSNETRSRGEARGTVRRGGTPAGSRVTVEGRRGDSSRNRSVERRREGAHDVERRQEGRTVERRSVERRSEGRRSEGRGSEGRTYERRADRNNDSRYRNEHAQRSRNRSSDRYRNDGRFENDGRFRNDGATTAIAELALRQSPAVPRDGRVSRYERYGGGYRVWIHGAPYPFYVPLAYWHHDRFRVGLTISLGGYYNPLGYYDYWDGYRDGSYNSGYRAHSEADFRGVVESVDHRRDSFVVRNDDTGNFITVVLRDEREALPRAGDYVAVRGDWTTRGYFRAYDVDFLDNDRYERY